MSKETAREEIKDETHQVQDEEQEELEDKDVEDAKREEIKDETHQVQDEEQEELEDKDVEEED
jgi:fructose-1-phosphate kinase PfkB-like protein